MTSHGLDLFLQLEDITWPRSIPTTWGHHMTYIYSYNLRTSHDLDLFPQLEDITWPGSIPTTWARYLGNASPCAWGIRASATYMTMTQNDKHCPSTTRGCRNMHWYSNEYTRGVRRPPSTAHLGIDTYENPSRTLYDFQITMQVFRTITQLTYFRSYGLYVSKSITFSWTFLAV